MFAMPKYAKRNLPRVDPRICVPKLWLADNTNYKLYFNLMN